MRKSKQNKRTRVTVSNRRLARDSVEKERPRKKGGRERTKAQGTKSGRCLVISTRKTGRVGKLNKTQGIGPR